MSHVRSISGEAAGPAVVTVGGFDGVHRGHVEIIDRVLEAAGTDATSTVVSFDPHPGAVLAGRAPAELTTLPERARLCRERGIDHFAVIEFDANVAGMTPRAYVEQILRDELDASVVVVGHDHRFGQGASGDTRLLKELGREFGFEVLEVDAVQVGGGIVSSSRIRVHVGRGEVTLAGDLLGRRYGLTGRVGHGDGRGRTIGYPTANLMDIQPGKLTPADGVYAVSISGDRLDGTQHGMMNIGTRPTFDGGDRHLEVHIFDVDLDLYESELRVEFAERIREERKFDSVDALVSQLKADEVRCRAALSTQGSASRQR